MEEKGAEISAIPREEEEDDGHREGKKKEKRKEEAGEIEPMQRISSSMNSNIIIGKNHFYFM